MKKFLRYAHRYLGYVTGVILAVTCLTGAILVFEKEITSALNHHLYRIENVANQQRLSPEGLLMKVSPALNGEIESLTVNAGDNQSWGVALKDGEKITYINPYTGAVLGEAAGRHPFFIGVMKLHRVLLADDAGRMVVGISTIIFTLMLISGLVVWLPPYLGRLRSYIRSIRKKASFARGGNRYRKLYDWHVLPALVALPLLLLMSLTGPTWSFKWYRSGAYAVLGAEAPEHKKPERDGENAKQQPSSYTYVGLDAAVASVKEASPLAQSLTVKLPARKGEYSITTLGKNPLTRRQTDSFTYSIEKAKIVKSELWKDKPRSAKMPAWIYAFHTGTWGGVFSKVLYLLAVLVGAALPILGFMMLVARTRRRSLRQ